MNTPTFAEMVSSVLISYELTEEELAALLKCSQATVNRLKNGMQQPGYSLGAAIAAKWAARPTTARA